MFSFLRGFLWLCIRSLAWLLRHAPFYQDGTVGRKCIWNLFGNLCSCYALPKENQLTLSENLLLQLVLYSETAIFILCYFQIKSPAIFRLVFLKSFQVNILSKLNFHYCNSRDNLCCHGSVVSWVFWRSLGRFLSDKSPQDLAVEEAKLGRFTFQDIVINCLSVLAKNCYKRNKKSLSIVFVVANSVFSRLC